MEYGVSTFNNHTQSFLFIFTFVFYLTIDALNTNNIYK